VVPVPVGPADPRFRFGLLVLVTHFLGVHPGRWVDGGAGGWCIMEPGNTGFFSLPSDLKRDVFI
jgi:hypothetical protein